MVTTTNKTAVSDMINRLREIADQTAESEYETATILHAMRFNRLYEFVGYDSFYEFVDEADLGFSPADWYTVRSVDHSSEETQVQQERVHRIAT